MRLSHSSASMYNACGFKWYMHYQRRLREPVKSAALHFGDCLDKAFGAMLNDHKAGAVRPLEVYKARFNQLWKSVAILNENGQEQVVDATTTNGLVYAESDFDKDLILLDYVDAINQIIQGDLDLPELLKRYTYFKLLKKEEGLTDSQQMFMNVMNWFSLKTKGQLMVDALHALVLPKITAVYEIQKMVTLDDGAGNDIVGFVDAVLDFGNDPVICDLKTSNMVYEKDSANNSEQLALYRHCLADTYKTDKVAFLVLYKQMKKTRIKACSQCNMQAKEGSRHKTCYNTVNNRRCGGEWDEQLTMRAEFDMIEGRIDETFESMVVENYDEVIRGLKAGIFTKNWDFCDAFGKKCAYYNFCRTGSEKGLVKV